MAWKLYDPAASVCSVLEFGTFPDAFRLTVPAGLPEPWQEPLAKNVYVTVPVAVIVSDVDTVEVSYADAPVVSVPVHGAFADASNTAVAVVDEPFPTLKHSLVAPPE